MKKLFALLFAAVAFSLAMPVFAQEASPEKLPQTTKAEKKTKKAKTKKAKKTKEQKTEETPKQ